MTAVGTICEFWNIIASMSDDGSGIRNLFFGFFWSMEKWIFKSKIIALFGDIENTSKPMHYYIDFMKHEIVLLPKIQFWTQLHHYAKLLC